MRRLKRICRMFSKKRGADKYHYVYPDGESYETMKPRITEGIKKAFFLNRRADNIMIVGHQAINRMILSHFLYRREMMFPNLRSAGSFYHIVSTTIKTFRTQKVQFGLKAFRLSHGTTCLG